ncbi:hypothetical protein FA15DRAFT_704667 [Coprinopsis marcescibilis]|uniref:Uncharacterized protein n=1 Tax=Coprinopsis marcescibilis TaxID=230819 RepID=A0A5C3KUY9_COPMA|nr:hypothetical protein FA15DRAFT_704667 [Coprinopsis marcescibilis]
MKISSSFLGVAFLVVAFANSVLSQDWEDLSEREENDSPGSYYQRDINTNDIAEEVLSRLQYESLEARQAKRKGRVKCLMDSRSSRLGGGPVKKCDMQKCSKSGAQCIFRNAKCFMRRKSSYPPEEFMKACAQCRCSKKLVSFV